jgi:hypothetical protein
MVGGDEQQVSSGLNDILNSQTQEMWSSLLVYEECSSAAKRKASDPNMAFT